MYAAEALQFCLKNFEFDSVLDIGSGQGLQASVFEDHGKRVTRIDLGQSVYFELADECARESFVVDDYLEWSPEQKFDLIWASHVLEHQLNPNLFLKKVNNDLKEGGVLAITEPPLKHEIVGGHVTLWNAGILMYNLVLAGFREALDKPADPRDNVPVIAGGGRVHGRQAARIR